jgi:hypothetical protein
MNLLTLPITTAQAAVTQVLSAPGALRNLTIQGNFTYGSGGTSADAYVQTSLDGGTTWVDIANFHFTTSSARFVYNLSAATPKTTQVTPTDGSLTANTALDGILGAKYRVKTVTVGTYAGSTSLSVDVASIDLPA